MPAITVQQLNDAALDVDHITAVATSTAPTVTDRFNVQKTTMRGASDRMDYKVAEVEVAKLAANQLMADKANSVIGITVRGAWVTGTAYAVKDVFSNSGTWYVTVIAHTSSASFASDAANVRVYQGVTTGDLAAQTTSAALGHIGSGVGAVPRTVASKLGDVVSVFDFMTSAEIADVESGAGALDVTAAVNAACAVGVVEASGGVYKITSAIIVPYGLFGKSPSQTVFKIIGNGYDAFTLSNSNAYMENVGFTSPSARSSGITVKLAENKRSQKLKNFKMGKQFTGVTVGNGCVISEIESGEIIDLHPTTGVGIDVLGGNDTFITRVVMDNALGFEPASGIRIQKTDAVWLTDNDVIHCGNGLQITPDGSLGQYITWIFGSNNAFDSSAVGTGTYIRAINNASIRGCQFMGHWCATNAVGISISTDASASTVIDGIKFVAPRIVNNKQHGIIVDGGTKITNTQIIEPTCSGNGSQAVDSFDGIVFGNNSILFTVRGGKVGASLGFAGTQRYGVNIGSGCIGYEIADVDLNGNSIGAVVNASWAAANGRVKGNSGSPTRTSGLAAFSSGATDVTITHGLATTPTYAIATPTNTNMAGVGYWTGSFGASTFKINFSAPAIGAGIFSWQAEV